MLPVDEIAAERQRQLEVEGFTLERDDSYIFGELAGAAGCYALSGADYRGPEVLELWPWALEWWKPGNPDTIEGRRRSLVKAGALILAEIERLDRVTALHSDLGAPHHTDLMVTPESLDDFVKENPPMTGTTWGPWIDHDGGDRPVEYGVEVQLRFVNGETTEAYVTHSQDWDWDEEGDYAIVAYRTRDNVV